MPHAHVQHWRDAVLARRLGLPKDSLRMAPAELLQDVLGVPLGSATPLALANSTAASVILMLDRRLQRQQHLWVRSWRRKQREYRKSPLAPVVCAREHFRCEFIAARDVNLCRCTH